MAPYASQLLSSPYWSTIIGITAVEQSYSIKPGGTNWNLFGLMGCHGLCYYGTAQEGLDAINGFLVNAERNGRTTLESFEGWYCVNRNYPGNVCPNWEATVIKVKLQFEAQ